MQRFRQLRRQLWADVAAKAVAEARAAASAATIAGAAADAGNAAVADDAADTGNAAVWEMIPRWQSGVLGVPAPCC